MATNGIAPITAPPKDEQEAPDPGRAIERMRGFMEVVGPVDEAAEARKQAARSRPILPPEGKTEKPIRVYVCPTPDCLDYYGASGMGDLAQKKTYPPTEHVAAHEARTGQRHLHSRAVCPTCKSRGLAQEDGSPIERVLVVVMVLV